MGCITQYNAWMWSVNFDLCVLEMGYTTKDRGNEIRYVRNGVASRYLHYSYQILIKSVSSLAIYNAQFYSDTTQNY